MKAFFVTGTDTGIGKTTVACAMLEHARTLGLTTLGLKPVAAGCEMTPGGWRNSDALMLQSASTVALSYEEINPLALPAPLSPHLAARAAGRRPTLMQLTGHMRAALMQRPDLAVIEGAGGWRVLLNDRELLSALPRELKIPVILVVGVRLGCLNHALLTAEAVIKDGLRLAGWVANIMDPDIGDLEGNLSTLRALMPAPCLGLIPHAPQASPAELASSLDLQPLFA